MGEQLGTAAVTNIWVPDGMKDLPVDRQGYRQRLAESLDRVLAEPLNPAHNIDAVECKLFGIGSESMVVGSHEFYLGYAIQKQMALCLDAGHFHPTEGIADKISSVLRYVPELLLHVPVECVGIAIMLFYSMMRPSKLCKNWSVVTHSGDAYRVDFFDASINRIAAWSIGTRSAQKSLLCALLEPTEQLKAAELAGDYTTRLALLERAKALPWSVVWETFCERNNVPGEIQLLILLRPTNPRCSQSAVSCYLFPSKTAVLFRDCGFLLYKS